MANRYMTQFPLTLEKQVKSIFAKVSFGASGAPTLSAPNSKGVVSVTRNSAGLFTFVFGTSAQALDLYYKLLMVKHVFFPVAPANPASPQMHINTLNMNVVGSASIQVEFTSGGTATDPASGETVFMEFIFGDSNSG
jgi:hypothetical protein